MNLSRLSAFAVATIISISSIAAPAHAGLFDAVKGVVKNRVENRQQTASSGGVLGRLNPAYTRCVSNTMSQLTPSYRDGLRDKVTSLCAKNHGLYGK